LEEVTVKKISVKVAAAALFFLAAGCFLYADKESDLRILQEAYPGAFEISARGIRFPDGTEIPYDDGEEKDFNALFENPDLEDMLRLPYPLAWQEEAPGENFDPGRFRPDAFFKALYGKTKEEIQAGLGYVRWMPSRGGPRLLVTTRFGVDKKLEEVIRELEELGPEYTAWLLPPGGTFNYRVISRTNRLSMHSFGIAVDIATGKSNYWQWERDGAAAYKNSIPHEIVAIFEKHGFIWGGKWYHFDTMHFEYRPEILLKARLARKTQDSESGRPPD
jgi:hypothetical protein